MFRKRGFTLIELVMIIVILGILAATAIPRYVDLRTEARSASERGVAGGVRGGIMTYYAEYKTFPPALDGVAVSTACSSSAICFDYILAGGITEGPAASDGWEKDGSGDYVGPRNTGSWAYDNSDGSFIYTP